MTNEQQANNGTTRLQIVEAVKDGTDGDLFEQRSHTLMLEAIDKLAHDWISELARIRDQSSALERMVISQAAKVKTELTRMHLLGVQSMRVTDRTVEINRHLAEELERMMEGDETIAN